MHLAESREGLNMGESSASPKRRYSSFVIAFKVWQSRVSFIFVLLQVELRCQDKALCEKGEILLLKLLLTPSYICEKKYDMKRPNSNNLIAILLLLLCCINAGCNRPDTTKPPGKKDLNGIADSLRANVPDIFQAPIAECPKVTDLRFFGKSVGTGFTNWEATWLDGSSTQNTYAVKLFDSRLSLSQPIWSWIVNEKSLNIGILEGNPDDNATPFKLAVVAICPSIGQSDIVIEDVAMK